MKAYTSEEIKSTTGYSPEEISALAINVASVLMEAISTIWSTVGPWYKSYGHLLLIPKERLN